MTVAPTIPPGRGPTSPAPLAAAAPNYPPPSAAVAAAAAAVAALPATRRLALEEIVAQYYELLDTEAYGRARLMGIETDAIDDVQRQMMGSRIAMRHMWEAPAPRPNDAEEFDRVFQLFLNRQA